MLDSISHIALVVRDPARTARLFEQLFGTGARMRQDEDGHTEIFVKLGGVWFALVHGDVERAKTGDHVAFRATREVIENTKAKLEAAKRDFILNPTATRLYFFDDDNHVFELDAGDLEEDLRSSSFA